MPPPTRRMTRRRFPTPTTVIIALLTAALGWSWFGAEATPPGLSGLLDAAGLGKGGGRKPITLAVATDSPQAGGTGATMVNGMRLLVEDVNRAGGIDGRPLRLEVFDDGGGAESSKAAAAKLVRDSDAVAVIGHRLSAATKAAGPIYAAHGIAAISPASTSTDVTEGNEWLFRTVFNNDFLGRFLTRYIHAVFKPGEVVVAAGRHSYARELIALMQAEAQRVGMGVAGPEFVEAGTAAGGPETRAAIERILERLRAASGPRVLFLALYPEEAVPVVQAVRDAGLEDVTLIGPDSLDRIDFPRLFQALPAERRTPGFYSNGITIASSVVYDTAGRTAGFFREQYVRRFGQSPDWRAALAYDAGRAVVEAIRQSGGAAGVPSAALRRNIRNGLASMTSVETAAEGIAGPILFDDQGNATRPAAIARYQNGELLSDFAQFQTLRKLPPGARLPDLVKAGQIISVGERLFERTQVAFSGLLVQDVAKVDLGAFTADLSGEVWFRYARPNTNADQTAATASPAADPSDVVFLNAAGPVRLEVREENTTEGGIVYRRLGFSGTFRIDFVPGMRSYRHPAIGVEFRHRTQPANRLLYVADLAGMGMSDGGGYTHTLRDLAPVLEAQGWQLREATVFQGQELVSTLGDPRHLSQDRGMAPYSTFAAVVRLDEIAGQSLSNLLPERRGLTLFGALAALALAGFANRSIRRPGARLPLLAAELASAAVALSAARLYSIESLQEHLPFVYLDSIERGFQAGWWLLGAYGLDTAIKRFLWDPLERRTERKVPAILRHSVSSVILLLCLFGIIAFVFDQPLTSLLATSGLVTLIIGLAIQTNLSNIFAGIVLSLERPFSLGDTIKFGDQEPARVADMSWRTTRLEDGFGYVRCIPNSNVAETVLVNYSRRSPLGDVQQVLLPPDVAPERAIAVLRGALAQCRGILQDRSADVAFLGIQMVDHNAVGRYALSYTPAAGASRWAAAEEVTARVRERLSAEDLPPVEAR